MRGEARARTHVRDCVRGTVCRCRAQSEAHRDLRVCICDTKRGPRDPRGRRAPSPCLDGRDLRDERTWELWCVVVVSERSSFPVAARDNVRQTSFAVGVPWREQGGHFRARPGCIRTVADAQRPPGDDVNSAGGANSICRRALSSRRLRAHSFAHEMLGQQESSNCLRCGGPTRARARLVAGYRASVPTYAPHAPTPLPIPPRRAPADTRVPAGVITCHAREEARVHEPSRASARPRPNLRRALPLCGQAEGRRARANRGAAGRRATQG